MFTGIVESTATVTDVLRDQSNIDLVLNCPFVHELKIDQSVAHNGVCLTVVEINLPQSSYRVTAIKETLDRSNLGSIKKGDEVNLERCMRLGDRLDGHMVQGHVDCIAHVEKIELEDGSHKFWFQYLPEGPRITVAKGSICVNGASLTVVDSAPGKFSIALIPYTFEHTNFKHFEIGDPVNLEFDILGKYIAELMSARSLS
ncbi:MAG: riboflavin synthase [Flavobacteriales bacterium]|jgi:riboflavin synthase